MKRIISLLIALPLLVSTAFAGSVGNLGNFSFDWGGSTGRIAAFYSPFTTTLSVLTAPRSGLTGTFTRASAQYLVNDSNELTQFASGVPATNSKGILLEPASTNKVTAYGIIPADTLGSELITNAADREFSSDTGFWTKEVGWAIGSGTLNATNTGTTKYVYRSAATVGKIYQITFTITSIAKGGVRAWFGGVAGTIRTTPGTYTETGGPLTNVNYGISSVGDTTASVDNVSVKEVQWAVGTKSYWTGSAFQQNISGLTISSAETSPVLSIADGTSDVIAAGLLAINPTGKVYKVENPGATVPAFMIFNGAVGNVNPHSMQVVASKVGSGTPFLYLRADAANKVNITSSALTLFASSNITPNASDRSLRISCPPDTTVYFILPQLEEQPAATSYIPTAGATATRAATSLSYPTTGIFSLHLSGTFYWTPNGIKGSTEYLWGSYLDANNSIGVFYDGTNVVFRKRVGGSNFDATKALTAVVGTTYKIGWRINANLTTDIFVNSVKGTGSANTSVPAATTTFQLGTLNSANGVISSQIKDFKIFKKALPDSLMFLEWKYRSPDNYMEAAA